MRLQVADIKDSYCTVRTKDMGMCWCGHCYCRVYGDGTIQYCGLEHWQCSDRREFLWGKEPRRMYGSQLDVGAYEEALDMVIQWAEEETGKEA